MEESHESELSNQLLLEGFRQSHEHFRWCANARLVINRFFFIFFVSVAALIGYLLSPQCPFSKIGIDLDVIAGLAAYLASIIGLLLIWTNIGFSFSLADHAWAIEFFQRKCNITQELLKYVKDEEYPEWVNPNRVQLLCMSLIVLIFIILGYYLLRGSSCLVHIIPASVYIVIIAGVIFHRKRWMKFRENRDLKFKEPYPVVGVAPDPDGIKRDAEINSSK